MTIDLKAVRRIAVIGCSGAGKSTLSVQLAAWTGLPLVHLDREYWRAGWGEPDLDVWREQVARLVEGDRWISDGMYGATLAIRARRADAIVFLDFPTWLCFWGVMVRTLRSHGRTRPDMGEGCIERWSWRFLRFVIAFRRVHRPRVLARLAEADAEARTIVCRSRADVRRLVQALERHEQVGPPSPRA